MIKSKTPIGFSFGNMDSKHIWHFHQISGPIVIPNWY